MADSLILVTGATGMIGFRVLVRALEKGHRVRVAVRNQDGFDRIKSLPSVQPYIGRLEPVIVPDIAVTGAYDKAVKGVEYVIHVAAPLAQSYFTDFDNEVIIPSVKGTVGMLESACKENKIRRVVITGSVAHVVAGRHILAEPGDTVYSEKSVAQTPTGPYANVFEAYMASKALAYHASQSFMNDKKPAFDLITIGPGFVLGRDENITEASNIGKGSNGLMIGQLFGQVAPFPLPSVTAHVDDVAMLHIESLNPTIAGNQFFLATSDGPEGPTWADAIEIVKKRYPNQVAQGTFTIDKGATGTLRMKSDSSYTEKTFGFKFQSYENQISSVVNHFLELSGQK
ncbi:hypothetical protein F5884DRAFT_888835 [Xylogone sp. PMI_703]|nr:hypothetical protein F5884DRAFT_888835 [Xylogone sp. PMI_703]